MIQLRKDGPVNGIDARVVKLAGNGTKDGHLVNIFVPKLMVALVLLFYSLERILRSSLVKLIDGNHIGEIQHVNFFELGRCPKFWGHDVQRDIAVVNNFGI